MQLWTRLFLLILVLSLIPIYIGAVTAIPAATSADCETGGDPTATDEVGFCNEIAVSVTRSYYAGMLRLPVSVAGANIDLLNRAFLPLLLLAALAVLRL